MLNAAGVAPSICTTWRSLIVPSVAVTVTSSPFWGTPVESTVATTLAVPLPLVVAETGAKEIAELFEEKVIVSPAATGLTTAEAAKLPPRLADAGMVSVIALLAVAEELI